VFLLSFFPVDSGGYFVPMIANSVRLSEALRQMQHCQLSKRRVVGARRPAGTADVADTPSRMPAHFQNATRNIVQGNSSQPRKVHIWLLLTFNGQRVVLG
jgi:hypothetical protein